MKFKQFLFLSVVIATVLSISLYSPLLAENKTKSKIPDYSLTERKDIPVEYTWRVEDLYPGIEEWKKEKTQVNEMMSQLETLSKDWTTSPQKMLALLKLEGQIKNNALKLYIYASLQNDSNLADPRFQQMTGETQNLRIQIATLLSFMDPDVLKLGKELFHQYVQKEPGLKPYVFKIEKILRTEAHVLPPEQEKIYAYSQLFSETPGRVSGILNNVELPQPQITLSNGEKITLNYANYILYRADKNRADRTLVMETYWENHKKFENTFAALINGAMNQHLFNARVHHYNDCLEAQLFADNIDPAVYHKLIRLTRENLEPLHRYLKIKQELLGLEQFKYEDIYASAVKSIEKKYTYEEAQKIILDMMKVLGKEYSDGLDRAFNNRWIDRYPNKNKEQGAYSTSTYGIHPYIKMNYNGEYDALSTLAHELGHTMHSYFADKTQHQSNSEYSLFLAEIASTFNENILVEYLLKHEKDDLLKLFILDAFFQQIKGTVYRQVHFAEFELAMHREVEAGKTLTPDWLNKKFLELARFYYGHDKGVTEVGDYIQNEWASVPHFYRPFYVYNYSTGMIASTALAEMVLTGKTAEKEKYLDFLKTGGSRYPLETLKLAGVDITTDKPYLMAFKRFNQLVSEMEKILQRIKDK